MSLVIWTSAPAESIRKVFTSAVGEARIPHRIDPDASRFPKVMEGDVVLACGSKALAVLMGLKKVSKGRTITSMRETLINVDGVPTFVTFDPTIVSKDYARLPDIQWDTQLSIRYLTTGTTRPEIGKYEYVESLDELIDEIRSIHKATGKAVPLTADLETLGLDEYNPGGWIIACAFTLKPGTAVVLYFEKGEQPTRPVQGVNPDYWGELWLQLEWLFTSKKILLRGANFKYDSRWIFQHWGIEVTNLVMDTVLVGGLIDENRSNSLKLHAKVYTPMGGYEDDMKSKYDMARLDLVPKLELLPYVAGDTDATYRVSEALLKLLFKDKLLTNFYVHVLHPSSKVFEKMERTGILVDQAYYHRLDAEIEEEIARIENEMMEFVPRRIQVKYSDNFSFSRAAILKDLMFSPAGFNLTPRQFTEKTHEPSTAIEHLLTFEDDVEAQEFVKLLKELNSATKTLSTFVRGFLADLRSDGRFHPSYFLARGEFGGKKKTDSGTVTGRSSASNPAVQCLSGDSLVLTRGGWVTILQLVARYEAGDDFKVLTHTGKWQRVIGVYRNGVKDVFSVSSEHGKLLSTGNHPFLTKRGWVRTDQLTDKDIGYALKGIRNPAQDSKPHDPNLPQLGSHEELMHQPDQQGVASVWREGDYPLPSVAHLPEFPSRHGGEAQRGVVNREAGCKRGLRAGELYLGHSQDSAGQSAQLQANHSQGGDKDRSPVGDRRGYFTREASLPFIQGDANGVSLDEAESVERGVFQESRILSIVPAGSAETFDITVEGSHSFVANGMVVHNTLPKHTIWSKRLRRALIAPPGYGILQLDYSQGELKIAACLARDPVMLQAYLNGADLHAITAAQLSGYSYADFMLLPDSIRDELRSGGKCGNFGLIYGMGANGFKEYAYTTYGVKMTEQEAAMKREAFFELYSHLPLWHNECKTFAKNTGHVRSPLGRIRHLPLINSSDREARAQAERQAVNSPVQATLSDMMQMAMIQIDKEYGDQVNMFLMTHDSIAAYVPLGEEVVWAKRFKAILDNLPLKKLFGWDHQLQFTSDAEFAEPDSEGVLSLAKLTKIKGL